MLAGDYHTSVALDPLCGRRFAKGDEREVVWAECKEGVSSGDEPNKGGLVV
jgi:hypothetical protein